MITLKNQNLQIEFPEALSIKEVQEIQSDLLKFVKSQENQEFKFYSRKEVRNLFYLAIQFIKFQPNNNQTKEIELAFYDRVESEKLIQIVEKYDDPFSLALYFENR